MSINAHFYDIETLDNVFTLSSFDVETNTVRIYVLLNRSTDNEPLPMPQTEQFISRLTHHVQTNNLENFSTGNVELIDLHTQAGVIELSKEFGFVHPFDPKAPIVLDDKTRRDHNVWKLVADTDPTYDPTEHYYLMGYNSLNYDTVMLALFFHEAWEYDPSANTVSFADVSPTTLRDYNNKLFSTKFKQQMSSYLTYNPKTPTRNDWSDPRFVTRKNMLSTGRFIDVARLNEKQRHVSLKRLLGLIGAQILESDKLTGVSSINSTEELFDLLAYNVSDVVNLYTLFNTKLYSSQFDLKREMLKSYPELVFESGSSTKVRRNRLYADSTSQQLASRALCPDNTLHDKETVSYLYPAESKLKETSLTAPYDVCDASRDFFMNTVLSYVPEQDRQNRAQEFDNIYSYYADIRGNNFDSSTDYCDTYPDGTLPDENSRLRYISSLKDDIPRRPNNICYIGSDGKPTNCYVTFSTGGIHGAEYNQALFEADLQLHRLALANLELVKQTYGYADGECRFDNNGVEIFTPGPVALYRQLDKKTDPIPLDFPDNKQHFITEFVATRLAKGTKSKPGHGTWKQPPTPPQLFLTKRDGSTILNKRYTFTSFAKVNHEDFTSYYPNLLRMMDVFKNPHIEGDRYGEIFEGKQTYDKIRKDPTKSNDERAIANLKRDGVKLILNTASGAGDSTFDNPVRMNNNIIAMRIIGQNFTWRIAQEQALHGARVISTNTDGIYTVLEEDLNNKILTDVSKNINVEIEPEVLYLISKDSNNRIEYTLDEQNQPQIISASGTDLACHAGTDPSKSLAHPAICDYILCQYLVQITHEYGQDALSQPFDVTRATDILTHAMSTFSLEQLCLYFQNICASSPSSFTYLFGKDASDNIVNLQKDNRVFYMNSTFTNPSFQIVHLHKATGKKITDAQLDRRKRNNLALTQDDPIALTVLKHHNVNIAQMRETNGTREASVEKITGIDPAWSVLIFNNAILGADPTTLQTIIDNLDLSIYLTYVKNTYENNWRNNVEIKS